MYRVNRSRGTGFKIDEHEYEEKLHKFKLNTRLKWQRTTISHTKQ